jgi:hypothetical protein
VSPIINAVNLSISIDGLSSTAANIVAGTLKRFSLNTFREIPLGDVTIKNDSVYNPSDCSCKNMLLESHYTVYYSDYADTYNTSFKIDNITVDLIYGDYIPNSCPNSNNSAA